LVVILGAGALLVAGLGVRTVLGTRGHPTPASAAAQIQDAAGSVAAHVLQPARPMPPPASFPVPVQSLGLPAGLVAGTCIEFNPAGADQHHTVFLDPGHGGPDPGSVGNGVQEKNLTLAVALRLKDALRGDGFHVVLSRVSDTSVAKLADSQVVNGVITNSGAHLDTIARIACANSAAADALVSIHFNGYHDPSASGSETFYDNARGFSAANLRLATLLQSSLQASFGKAGWQVFNRGVLSDSDTGASGLTAAADAYGRLMEIGPPKPGWNDNPSQMPGAITEPFFVTNPVEAQVVDSAAGQRAIAAGLEQGVLAFLTSPAAGPVPTPGS
jgi:N-acetylmuramoyl-L-alanine amidase